MTQADIIMGILLHELLAYDGRPWWHSSDQTKNISRTCRSVIAVAALSSRWAGHDGIGHRSKQFSFGSWFQCSAGLSPSLMLILHLSDALICMSTKQKIKTQKSWISWRRDGIHMAGIEKIPNCLRIAPKAHSIKVSDLSTPHVHPDARSTFRYSITARPHPPFDPILQLKPLTQFTAAELSQKLSLLTMLFLDNSEWCDSWNNEHFHQ